MSLLVVPLAGAAPASVGGKGASLASLLAAGLPVPSGFVVTAEAHRAAGEGMTPAIRAAIVDAYAALGRPPVAVRSSATAEDLEGASFAGQYDTELGVVGDDALVAAVERIWASLWSSRAAAYRRDRGITDEGLAMAVVVQAMVDADVAGVLFTRHPLTGAEDVVVMSVARGLGDGVVDGTAPTETLVVDAGTGRVVDRTADDGAHGVVSDRLRRALVDLARRIHDALGHRDVEFAAVGDRVLLLQARPITALDDDAGAFVPEWPEPADADRSWALRGRAPMSRLEEDVQDALAAAMREGYAATATPFTASHLGMNVHGYRYAAAPDPDPAHVARVTADHRDRIESYRRAGTSLYEAEVEPVLLARLDELRRLGRRRSLPALVHRLERAIDAYALAMGDLHWRIQVEALDWPAEYARLTGRPSGEAQTLLQALENRTTRLISRLRRLARTVQSDPVLAEVVEARRWSALDEAEVAGREATGELRRGIELLLREHGLRTGMGMGGVADFRTPTWHMDPSVPLGMVATYARQDLDALDQRDRRLRRDRRRLERELHRDMADRPEAFAELDELRIHLANAARTTEDHNHLMEQALGGSMREAVDAVGRALVHRGLVDEADDVFHLSLEELRGIAAGNFDPDVRGVVAVRAREQRRRRTLNPPPFLGAPPATRPAGSPFGPVEGTGLDGSVLRGVAASRGRATGNARVVPPGHEPPDVRPGEILVASLAGEAWTPIWPLLGGLVLDRGGIFQHAAVVAREYGIPAVLSTREGTKVIADGQRITVDGDLGIVELG